MFALRNGYEIIVYHHVNYKKLKFYGLKESIAVLEDEIKLLKSLLGGVKRLLFL